MEESEDWILVRSRYFQDISIELSVDKSFVTFHWLEFILFLADCYTDGGEKCLERCKWYEKSLFSHALIAGYYCKYCVQNIFDHCVLNYWDSCNSACNLGKKLFI